MAGGSSAARPSGEIGHLAAIFSVLLLVGLAFGLLGDVPADAIDDRPIRAAPAQSTPEDPPNLPTETSERWRVSLRAFPDTVGRGGYACTGCDGVLSSGDTMGAAGAPLEPLLAAITEPGNAQNVYWIGQLDRQNESQAAVYVEAVLAVPPPYEVRLITTDPLGYVLCPNSPGVFFLTQEDFDEIAGGAGGGGRHQARDWFFWRCRGPR